MGKQAVEMADVIVEAADDPLEQEQQQVESQALAVVAQREQLTPATTVLPSAGEWEATMTMARTIAATTFVPKAYRGNPEAVVAGILYGREIGLGPMQALQKVHIIDGKPSLAAEEMLAQMRRHGLVIVRSESTQERAFIHARRQDTGEEAEVEWTIQDASDAGLTGKDNWSRYRQDMLWARCVGRLCRRLGSDLVGGMVYAAEEMQDWEEGGYGGSGYGTPATVTPVAKLTDWRDKRFDPAVSLAKGAPTGWKEIANLAMSLDLRLVEWMAEATQTMFGGPVREISDDTQRTECRNRLTNALCRVRDELFADGDFPPPSDDEYRRVFAWAFSGIRLQGPPPLFDTDLPMDEAAEAAQEPSDADWEPVEPEVQVPGQESLIGPEETSGGHVGTCEPDAD